MSSSGNPLVLAARVALVIAVLSACLFVCLEAASGKTLTIGSRRYNDYMLYNNTVRESASIFGKAKKDLCFPKFKNNPRVNITMYSVRDLNGTAGNVYVKSGGINSTQICMHFESKNRNTGFNFIFTVWGLYR